MVRLNLASSEVVNAPDWEKVERPKRVWFAPDNRVFAYFYTLEGQHWMQFPELASFRFDDSGEVTAIAPPDTPRKKISSVFYRSVLPLVLQTHGYEVLHASAVVTPSGVAALCGESRIGKTTLACELSVRGWPLWADDAVAFRGNHPQMEAVPLPFEVRLRSDTAAFFYDKHSEFRSRLNWIPSEAQVLPLRLIVLLKRQERDQSQPVEISRVKPGSAFPAVLDHAIYFSLEDQDRKQSMIQNYLDLVEKVPVFEMRFHPGLDKLSSTLESIEQLFRQ